MRGTLILVVGPSGAGKDTLIAGATARLAGDRRFLFARRAITRPAGAGAEDHEPIERGMFEALRAADGFLLAWEAHGFGYGLPAALDAALAAGTHVVANVSRTVLAEAQGRFPPVAVVAVEAPPELLAARLAARGREQDAAVAARLAREGAGIPEGIAPIALANDGTIEAGIARFLAALEGIAQTKPGA